MTDRPNYSTERRLCTNACRTAALCGNRNYERCNYARARCFACTTPSPFSNNYHFGPFRIHDYGYYQNPLYSPLYGQRSGDWRINTRPYYDATISSRGYSIGPGFYVNPYSLDYLSCDSICGYNLCQEWRDKMTKYRSCLADKNKSPQDCRDQHGCKNWRGYTYNKTAPIEPHRTNCQACWKSGYITY